MAAETIIAKFGATGLEELSSEIGEVANKMDLFAKAQNIVTTSTDGLTKKQLELREQINSIGGILKKQNELGRESGSLAQSLKTQLTGLVAAYEAENKQLKTKSETLKKVTLDSNNYAKVLEQVAKGEVSAREAGKMLVQEMVKLKLEGKDNTKQFQELKKVAGELKDTVADASAEIRQSGSDTRGLDHVLRVTNTVAAGFGLAQAGAALFGNENQDLQKTLLRVNAVMLGLTSAQQIQEELTKKDSVFTSIAAAAKKLYATAVGEATAATYAFRVALFALGIGAVIALVYLAVKAFSDWGQSIGSAARQAKLLADSRAEALKSTEKEVASIYELVAIAKNENVSRADRLEAIKQLQEQYPDYLSNISLETIGTQATNQAIADQIDLLTTREQINQLVSQRAKLSNSLLDKKSIEESITTLDKFRAAFNNSIYAKLLGISGSFDIDAAKEKVKSTIDSQITDIDATINTLIDKIGKSGKSLFDTKVNGTPEQKEKAIRDITAFNDRNIKLYKKSLDEQNKIYMDYLEKKLKANQDNIDKIRAQQSKENEQLQAHLNNLEALNNANAQKLSDRKAQENADKQRSDDDYLKAQMQRQADGLLITAEIGRSIFNISKQISDAKISILDEELNSGVISQKKYQKEVRKIKRQEAIAAKAEAIFNIGISIAEGIAKALAKGAGPVGIALGAIAATIGAIQLGIVASKPIPSFYKGVLRLGLNGNPKGRDTIPAMLDEGESVMTAKETNEHYNVLKSIRENKFHMQYIPVEKVLNPDLPAAINVGAHLRRMRGQHTEASVMQHLKFEISGMREELGYVGTYIKQGNAERIRGTNRLITTIEKGNSDGY